MNTGVIQRKVQTGSVSDPAIGQCQARVVVHEGWQGGVTAVVMTLAAMGVHYGVAPAPAD